VVRLRDANTILAEHVMEVECNRDAAMADSFTMVVGEGQFQNHHAALLEACSSAINVLSLARVSIEEHLDNIPRRFREVVHHVVRHGATLALATATL
jgi:hypothetical protein